VRRSRGGTSSATLVVDTTHILPIFNVETAAFGKGDLRELISARVEKLVPQCLLIEAKWVMYSLARRGVIRDLDEAIKDFNDGLRFLAYRRAFRIVDSSNPEIDLLESRIYRALGIRDYFDRAILAVAKYYNATLLTEDKDLLSLDTATHEAILPKRIVNWRALRKLLALA